MDINMFAFEVVGYKNILKNKNSQDAILYKSSNKFSLAVVCDGHSSDIFKYSDIGAKLACESVFDIVKNYDNEDLLIKDVEDKSFQLALKNIWRKKVYEHFYSLNYKAYKLNYKKYGTTICFCVLYDKKIVFFNLGDGSIVIKKDGFYRFVFEDNNYIVVNSIADDSCEKKMQYKILDYDGGDLNIILFSDGYLRGFKNYYKLYRNLSYVFSNIKGDVFKTYRFKIKYNKYLKVLTKNTSFDDISVIFLYKN